MPDVVKHAWTHRPRSEGGTDPIPIEQALPTAWAQGGAFNAVAGEYYSLTAVTGVEMVNNADGVADRITIANDPADGSGVWWPDTSDYNINIVNGVYAVQIEAGVGIDIDPPFTGYASLFVEGAVEFQTPVSGLIASELFDVSGFSNTPSVTVLELRLNATVIATGDLVEQNGNPLDVQLIYEGDIDPLPIRQSWCVMVALTKLSGAQQFEPPP